MGKPSTGYPGRGFIAYGGQIAKQVFLTDLLRRSEVATRVNLGARSRMIVGGSAGYEYVIESNVSDYLVRFRNRMTLVAVKSLEFAGAAGVQAAIDRFEETNKGTQSGVNSGDKQNIPRNIGYKLYTESNTLFGVSIGPINPSIKLLAAEFGLYAP